jgi:hypothetical protein
VQLSWSRPFKFHCILLSVLAPLGCNKPRQEVSPTTSNSAVVVDAGSPTTKKGASGPLSAEAARKESWRRSITRTPRPKPNGCYTATYPETSWRELTCKTPPNRPFLRKFGTRPRTSRGPATVGDGNDYSVITNTQTMSAEGSFDAVEGVTSENDNGSSNSYSLQLNTNGFSTVTCQNLLSSAPAQCSGWEQFIYSPDGGGYIQYWLFNFGPKCPSNWNTCYQLGSVCESQPQPGTETNCWRNSTNSAAAPGEPITSLGEVKLLGAVGDLVTVSIGDSVYSTSGDNTFPDLGSQWQTAEFNVFGDGGGTAAQFNVGSTLVVRTGMESTQNGTISFFNGGSTAETNNLTVVATPIVEPGTGSMLPSITFTESNLFFAASPDSQNSLWVVGGPGDMNLGMMAGTSASIAALPGAGWQAAFQANTGDLWVVGTKDDRGDMKLGMMVGTSPSITALPGAGWEAAFQANTGDLWVVGGDNRGDMKLGMMAGTSPSVTALPGGGWDVAFQANTGDLWVVGSDNRGDMKLGMMAGTSPSIAVLSTGGWEAAFQANTGDLWVVGSDNRGDMKLGMMAGTSPSIAALPGGGWDVAFQANTGDLWVVGTKNEWGDAKLGMMSGTSPSIAATATGGWQAAFQANTGDLWVVGTNGNVGDTRQKMMKGANPSIVCTAK